MRNSITAWTLVLAFLALPGCGSDDDDGNITAAALVLGFAVKGQVQGANALLYALHPTGAKGRLLGSAVADGNGRFQIDADFDGWAVAEVTGGTTTNFLGQTSTISDEFPLLGLTRVQRGQPTNVTASILSTIAFLMLKGEVLRGSCIEDAVLNVEYQLAELFGFFGSPAPAFAAPSGPILFERNLIRLIGGSQSATPETNYGALADGFCEMGIQLAIEELELAHLIGRDLLDGALDGEFFGSEIRSSGGTALPNNTLNSILPGAIGNFLSSQFNQSGLGPADIPALTTLQNFGGSLTRAPTIGSLSPSYARVDENEVIELRGFDLPSLASDTRIKVGGALIDPDDIETFAGGVRFTLRPDLGVVWDGEDRAPIQIKDAVSQLVATDYLSALRPTLQPTVRWFGPEVAASGGGTRIEITGRNLHAGTTVTVDSQLAEIVDNGAPTKITIVTPQLPVGSYSLQLNNGQGTTTAGTVTVTDRDLTADETETDNDAQLGFALQVGFNPGKFVSALTFHYDWQNADSGTSDITRHTVRSDAPTLNSETFNGVGTFRARCGRKESILNSSNDINFFLNQKRNGTVRAGNGPDAFVLGWKVPTGVERLTLAGEHYVNLQQWDFEQNVRRYMTGTMFLNEGGVGSITLRCIETAVDTAAESVDFLCGSFDWDVADNGRFSWTPRNFSILPQLDAYFSGDGSVGAATGSLGNSVIFANTVRLGTNQGLSSGVGAWGGHRHRELITENLNDIRYDVEHSAGSRDGGVVAGLTFFEEVIRDSQNTNDRFRWNMVTNGYLLNDRGLIRDSESGMLVGAAYRDDGFGFRAVGGIDPGGFGFQGAQVFLPGYQSDRSIAGLYAGPEIRAESDGDGGSGSSNTSGITRYDYDALIDPQLSIGLDYELAGRFRSNLRVGQTISRDTSRNVQIQSFNENEPIDKWFTVIGRTLVEFNLDENEVLRSGTVSPAGMSILLSDHGAGPATFKSILFKTIEGGANLNGDFRAAMLEKGYDLGNGDINLATESWSLSLNAGTFTAAGFRTDAFENQTTGSGNTSQSGTADKTSEGFTELVSSNRVLVLIPYADGESFAGAGVDSSGFQSIIFGTRIQETAPTVGNFRMLRMGYSFGDFGVFPPVLAMSSGVLKESFLSPGQIVLTGPISDHTNQTREPEIFQQFNTATLTYGNDGLATASEGTGPNRAGGGAPTVGYDSEADLSRFLFRLNIRHRW